MNFEEKKKELQSLPWHALYSYAINHGISETEVNNKDKKDIIEIIISKLKITEENIDMLVNDYIYGNRITFTIWLFDNKLNEHDYNAIKNIREIEQLEIEGFRNLNILNVNSFDDRLEVLYTYSKEYRYIDEQGRKTSVWEQHRGTVWVGIDISYVASISKHEKMTKFIVDYISKIVSKALKQIKPPKKAIERCVNSDALTRVVLQSAHGEKTIISNPEGLTAAQQTELSNVKNGRFDMSGSYIAEIAKDINGTIKYNVRKGNIGIYKHLATPVLFNWTNKAIHIILEEIENLKGKPAEEVFKEMGKEIKWNLMFARQREALNWILTQVISQLGRSDENIVKIPKKYEDILSKTELFFEIPKIYCYKCDDYETPICPNCGNVIQTKNGEFCECDCGINLRTEFVCGEGYSSYKIAPWYLPKPQLTEMINKNIKSIYPDSVMDLHFCIMEGDMIISHNHMNDSETELYFGDVKCFQRELNKDISKPKLQQIAVKMNEKCGSTCSKSKIQECLENPNMYCLPKVFNSIIPSFRPQPHKGNEYGDINGEITVNNTKYEMIGLIKKNTKNNGRNKVETMINEYLLSSSKEGQEIIRQFVEQGMNDARTKLILIVAPQYFDAGLKATLRYLAKLSKKKVMFIGLDEICNLINNNPNIIIE